MQSNTKWGKFIKELSNLFFFWFFGVLFFTVFRVIFIAVFQEKMSHAAGFNEIAKVLFAGFKFDCTAVAYFIIIPFLLLLVLSPFNLFNAIKTTRKVLQYLFVILSTIICVVSINYFKEYNNQFNNFMFLALYDDQKAVLKTVVEDFNPILNLISLIVIIAVGILIFKAFENKNFINSKLSKIHFKGSQFVIILVTLLLFVIGIRGSASTVPAIRKWAGVSKDEFLNKTVVNPFRSLKYAIKDFNDLNLLDGNNPFMPNGDFENLFTQEKITDVLLKKAKGATIEKPKQIFLVIMESYDSWPLMEKYLPFNLSSNLNSLAKKGTNFTNFIPASNSTFNSFGSITTNVPYCGVNIGTLGAINEPFKTSIFNQFKKLGYEINFYYGGFLSWQKIGEFTTYNGVERSFSGVDVEGGLASGSWGVEDEVLFNMVLKNTDTTKYSLNVILTTSYHPPYTVDVYSKGFPYKTIDDFPKEVSKYYDNGMTLDALGHLWYSDKAIGDFVTKAENRYPESVFCFTGDHYGRRFINHQPSLYEKSSVPFVVYGKSVQKQVNTTPGSHIDIMPTLIEMIAPEGFEYYSFGTSLFDEKIKYGIGFCKILTSNELLYFPKDKQIETFDLISKKKNYIDETSLKEHADKLMALSWHYIMKGDHIKEKIESQQ
ncbi:LTA synthase family protein [Algibacter agarivorans]|uniref:LTA synthase family protein n=1 Tax=Algibacter agarivorans TaxID=1109741 RepID=A0ABP9GCG7_9FLAO